jgi:hypothetical protein
MNSIRKGGILNFELNKEDERLEIHGDREGLMSFAKLLIEMINNNSQHRHLMTKSWGGEELTEDLIGKDNELINHVKIFYWSR